MVIRITVAALLLCTTTSSVWASRVDTVEYVNWQKENWQGASDLSFTYNLSVSNSTLHLAIEVIDDEVIFRDDDSIVSDHVELWLFDPRYVQIINKDLDTLRQFLAERRDMYTESEPKEVLELNNDMIKTCEEQIDKYRKLNPAVQYLFNRGQVFSSPPGLPTSGISYTCTRSDTGYSCDITISLQGRFDVCADSLEQLGYLVSVSDIDDADAARQKQMMSSKAGAKYGKPSTFNMTSHSIDLDVPDEALRISKLEPGGIFKAVEGSYKYFTKEDIPLIGFYGVDRHLVPGAFIETEFVQVSDVLLNVYYYGSTLRLAVNGKEEYMDLEGNISSAYVHEIHVLDVQYREGVYYLLLRVNGLSRWPPGSTNCGAGEEHDLILITLDSELKPMTVSSELIRSCFENIFDSLVEEDGRILVHLEGDSKKITVEYDKRNPEKGLVKTISEQ